MADRHEYESLLEDDDEDEDVSRHLFPLCDPTHLLHRILVLLFMCFLGFGSYFCYDNPAALQTQVIQDMSLNTASFMQLYSWYSWPNVFLCFLGGSLLDRVFGIRLGTIIFSLFVLVGQIIFAAGALADESGSFCVWYRRRASGCGSEHVCGELVQGKGAESGVRSAAQHGQTGQHGQHERHRLGLRPDSGDAGLSGTHHARGHTHDRGLHVSVLPHMCSDSGLPGQKSREDPPQGAGQNRGSRQADGRQGLSLLSLAHLHHLCGVLRGHLPIHWTGPSFLYREVWLHYCPGQSHQQYRVHHLGSGVSSAGLRG